MVSLPVLKSLSVEGYGLYPGTDARPGLEVEFKPGLTLVLGANGLGKTTLITMLYRLLTGAVDIPTLDGGGDLGNRSLDSRPLARGDRQTFASRVVDGAHEAHATLTFRLGSAELKVGRRLDNLKLTFLTLDGIAQELDDEVYESAVQRACGLTAFGDWILILRHLVFYFEDRRALVWDATAQRQLLRLLFLPAAAAGEWRTRERNIQQLDSEARNLQYALGKEERALARSEHALGSASDVRQQLRLLQDLQVADLDRLSQLEDGLAQADAARQAARSNALQAEKAHDSALRAVEHLELSAIDAAFPNAATTAKYILSQLVVSQRCLVCHTHVPAYAEELQARIQSSHCVVCGSLATEPKASKPSNRKLKAAEHRTAIAAQRLTETVRERDAAENRFDAMLSELTALMGITSGRSAIMSELTRQLPADEHALHDQRADLASMRARLAERRRELETLRTSFAAFVEDLNQTISSQKEVIKETFNALAGGFLFEACELIWSPRKSRIGETGAAIEFAAFELDLSGATFESPVRRTGPEQVSESQREFIDLAFRMALMQVADSAGASLVIDAPESSLDAVFVGRAAAVLTRFANPQLSNMLLVTSNLIDGDLIPELLRLGGVTSSRDSRVIDLLRIATPTAATRRWHHEYVEVRRRLFEKARGASQ